MLRRLLNFVGVVACVFLISPIPVAAQVDTTPPVLTAFDFTPKTIDTTSGPATVTFTFSATDDVSGVRSLFVLFESPSGRQAAGEAYCPTVATTCTASADITFLQYIEPGIWTIPWVNIRDAVNTGGYTRAQLAEMGFPTQLLSTPLFVPEPVFVNAGAVPSEPRGRWSTITLHALVQNIGNLPASNVRVGFAYSIDGGLTFSNIGASRAGTLAPGATGIAEYSWRTNPGEYVVRITIDPDNRVAEYDETNNSRVFPVAVR